MSSMGKELKVKGIVVLMRKDVLDLMDFNVASLLDGLQDFLGQRVSFQLVSATVGDPNNGNKGVVGKPAYLEESILASLESTAKGESVFELAFSWEEREGIPGAIAVKSSHQDQFFLKSLTIEDFPGKGRLHFVCNSWVYPVDKYGYDRIFFVNDTCLPENTTGPLKPYRQEELLHLRGEGADRQLEEWDRVYNYAFYNDLGDPDGGENLARPVLGGSERYPYPRRGRTGRPPTRTDPNSESRLPLLNLDIYVPRDERFGHIKTSDFLGSAIKALVQSLVPVLGAIFNETPNEFDSFEDVLKLYEGGLGVPESPAALIDAVKDNIPFESIKTIVSTSEGKSILSLPLPQVIEADKFAWRTDEEFAREMLAGVNPVMICRLKEFPPTSKLDTSKYGNQNSSITAAHIEKNLDGLTVEQALSRNRLFILDHHDTLMPYLNRINSTLSKVYATRTLLFVKGDGTLKPLVIELSLPSPQGEQHGAASKVFTPTDRVGVEGSIWQLAKAYVAVNDSGIHQLISHWLNTHATVKPFVIATHRHLSALHPINKLLVPHYRDTLNINALARQTLINAGGILELTVFPAKYAMEMSAVLYKGWKFTEQALPVDLLKRGVAVEDQNNIRLLIKDYPYAVDGMMIWSAIEAWVVEYCSIYYPNDAAVQSDAELQAWWNEVREVGHGDKKHEPWWPEMQAVSDLTQSCTTIIWVASALHAAVNFGQYPYAGYLPDRPTISRRFMPEPGSDFYELLRAEPDKAFLRTITSQLQTVIGVSLIEILSTHASDEVYLGQRDTPEWTTDRKALGAFERFGAKLGVIEQSIVRMNRDPGLLNRNGPVKMPYTLLFPTSSGGLTGKGIPNSVSI